MKKVLHYPKLKDYYSNSSEYSRTDALVHLEIKNFNLLNGLVGFILLSTILSIWNPLIMVLPISLFLFIIIEFFSLSQYCKNLEVERKINGVRFCEGDRLKVKYLFNLPLKYSIKLFEDFEGVCPDDQFFEIEKLKNEMYEKSFHLNQGFGEFKFNHFRIILSDEFNLFKIKIEFHQRKTIDIAPYVQYLPEQEYVSLSDAKNIGEYEFIKRGISPIFYGLREYRYGDPFKFINWKASTKTNKVLINEYENIQSLDAVIYIDLNPKHHIGMGINSTWEYCRDLALSIGENHSHRSHMLQVISSDFMSDNTQASTVIDDLRHYLHHHSKSVVSEARSARDSLSLIEPGTTITFILPLGFYTDLVELFEEIKLKSENYGRIEVFLIDAFNVVKENLSPDFKPRIMSEQKNSHDLIKKVKKELVARGVKLYICEVKEPHNIAKQIKIVL